MHTLGMITGALFVVIIYYLARKRHRSASASNAQKKQD